MTQYKIHWVKGKRYYRLPQVQALTKDYADEGVCTGCALHGLKENNNGCPKHRDTLLVTHNKPVICQDYQIDLDSASTWEKGKFEGFEILADFIYVPANRKGLADYVAHRLEFS